MIRVNLYTKNGIIWKFALKGHAGYEEHGKDIVCAAVSVLVINTIMAIKKFTDEKVKIKEDEESGFIECVFPNRKKGIYEEESELLIKTMMLGLTEIRDQYGEEYITIAVND
jgi:uncharacterized protein YsxB (DUF464 family)